MWGGSGRGMHSYFPGGVYQGFYVPLHTCGNLVKETNISSGEIDLGEYFYNPNALFVLIKCPPAFPVIGF